MHIFVTFCEISNIFIFSDITYRSNFTRMILPMILLESLKVTFDCQVSGKMDVIYLQFCIYVFKEK